MVFLVLILQICRADGAGDERRAKIILRWTFGRAKLNKNGLPNRRIYNKIKTMEKTSREILKEIQDLKTNDNSKVSETFVLILIAKKFAELVVVLAEEQKQAAVTSRHLGQ